MNNHISKNLTIKTTQFNDLPKEFTITSAYGLSAKEGQLAHSKFSSLQKLNSKKWGYLPLIAALSGIALSCIGLYKFLQPKPQPPPSIEPDLPLCPYHKIPILDLQPAEHTICWIQEEMEKNIKSIPDDLLIPKHKELDILKDKDLKLPSISNNSTVSNQKASSFFSTIGTIGTFIFGTGAVFLGLKGCRSKQNKNFNIKHDNKKNLNIQILNTIESNIPIKSDEQQFFLKEEEEEDPSKIYKSLLESENFTDFILNCCTNSDEKYQKCIYNGFDHYLKKIKDPLNDQDKEKSKEEIKKIVFQCVKHSDKSGCKYILHNRVLRLFDYFKNDIFPFEFVSTLKKNGIETKLQISKLTTMYINSDLNFISSTDNHVTEIITFVKNKIENKKNKKQQKIENDINNYNNKEIKNYNPNTILNNLECFLKEENKKGIFNFLVYQEGYYWRKEESYPIAKWSLENINLFEDEALFSVFLIRIVELIKNKEVLNDINIEKLNYFILKCLSNKIEKDIEDFIHEQYIISDWCKLNSKDRYPKKSLDEFCSKIVKNSNCQPVNYRIYQASKKDLDKNSTYSFLNLIIEFGMKNDEYNQDFFKEGLEILLKTVDINDLLPIALKCTSSGVKNPGYVVKLIKDILQIKQITLEHVDLLIKQFNKNYLFNNITYEPFIILIFENALSLLNDKDEYLKFIRNMLNSTTSYKIFEKGFDFLLEKKDFTDAIYIAFEFFAKMNKTDELIKKQIINKTITNCLNNNETDFIIMFIQAIEEEKEIMQNEWNIIRKNLQETEEILLIENAIKWLKNDKNTENNSPPKNSSDDHSNLMIIKTENK